MDGPAPRTSTNLDSSPAETAASALTSLEEATLRIEGASDSGRKSCYSLLVQGEVRESSILSSRDPDASVTLLQNNTKLLSGSVYGGRAGFVVSGKVLAAEFDDPEPTVTLDGDVVEDGRWPTVTEYLGAGPDQETVEDPFPDSGVLGATPGDPLDPEEYVVELDATGAADTGAFCFDVDGTITDHPESATISDGGDRVYGYLPAGNTAAIRVRGVITRIDTADGVDFSVAARRAR